MLDHKTKEIVAVIGSLNIDFVTTTPRVAEAGETLTATSFTTGFGGKGANQAVACARLSTHHVKTMMVGKIGDDTFGSEYLSALAKDHVDTSRIAVVKGERTGIANIIVDSSGENRILFAPNANYSMSPKEEIVPDHTRVAVFQLEIPHATVLHNIRVAREKGAYVILNPAPAVELRDEIYPFIDCVVLNETEADIMCANSEESWEAFFFSKGLRDLVVLTLGGEGVKFKARDGRTGHVPARKVKVVDTTAAGDTFVGALATKIAEHKGKTKEVEEFIGFANAAAARTVQKEGAMSAIPKLQEVLDSL